MSSRAGELRRQILANPEDVELRLIYADELQATGDPRGELIAVEHGLAARPALASRRAELLAAHARTWWPELPLHQLRTRAGFVEHLALTEHDLEPARRLFRTEPITSVELLDARGVAFVKAPWHARIRRLAVNGTLHAGALGGLVGSGLATTLVSLRLAGCLGALARDISPLGDALPSCRELVLADNPALGRHLPRLLEWQHLGRLELLDISRCSITDHVLATLLGRDLSSLRVLRISRNPLEAAGQRVLERALPRLPALQRVEAVECGLPAAAPPVIAELSGLGDRVTLDLIAATLELVRTGDAQWIVEIDGIRRPVRWQRGRTVGRDQQLLVDWTASDGAPLDTLAVALFAGAGRTLMASSAEIDPGSTSAYAYTSRIDSREAVTVEYPPLEGPVSIRFWEHVEVE